MNVQEMISFYNHVRVHGAHGKTPAEVFHGPQWVPGQVATYTVRYDQGA